MNHKPNPYGRHYATQRPKTLFGKATKPKPITESWWATPNAQTSREAWMAEADKRAGELNFTSSELLQATRPGRVA